jgi:hypothetical protein
MAVHQYRPAEPKTPPRAKFPVPWGLFIVLGVYGFGVLGYVWKTYWQSPEYQAAEAYTRALSVLGVDDGRSCTQAQLEAAFSDVLEAARLIPENKALAQHTERLRWRFDERGFTLPKDFARRAELVSLAARRVEEERSPWLAVGSRDRGWAPDQLLAAPSSVAWWSTPGVVLILAVWAVGQFSAKKVREREHEAALKRGEADVAALGQWRDGLSTKERLAVQRRPSPDDDEPTNPEAPVAPAPPPERKSSPGRPAVARASPDARAKVPSGVRRAVPRPPDESEE